MKLQPENYPIDAQLEEIKSKLEDSNCLLLKAETGAGKTTRLPPYLVAQQLGKVLVLEPRRLAAKLSAKRCAQTLECPLGERVGHHIRFDKKRSSATELLFITEGLFLSYLKEDSNLSEFDIIILDEFHERSIHTDIALALIRNLQKTTRPDLKLIIMSATLDTQRLEEYLEGPVIINATGRTYPLSIEYHDQLLPVDAITNMISSKDCTENILVFLPGVGSIKSLFNELQKKDLNGYSVAQLYSSLSKKDQDKVFETNDKKIILSTNIAETSLTIPNVTGVIDLGVEKRASFAPWSGMPLLLLEKISKASATQRAGRAGRVSDGIVYRLYSESDFSQRSAFTPAEVKRVELSHYLLDLLQLDISLESLHWFETPEEKNLQRSLDLLDLLGAIKENKLTLKGHFMADNPLHPRFGAMLWDQNLKKNKDLLLAVSILSEGMVLNNKAEFSKDDHDTCDLTLQCNLIKSYFLKNDSLSDYSTYFLDQKKAPRVLELYQSLCRRYNVAATLEERKTQADHLTLPLLQGHLDRVAMKKVKSGKGKKATPRTNYNFCMGRGGILSRHSSLSPNPPDYLIVLNALENPKANAAIGTQINCASKINLSIIQSVTNYPFLAPLISTQKTSIFNEKKATLKIQSELKYANLTLMTQDEDFSSPKGSVLVNIMKENWPWPFDSSEALDTYHQKVKLISKYKEDHPFALFTDEMFELFLESIIEDEETHFHSLKDKGLSILIENQMAPQDLYLFHQLTPNSIKLDNGFEFTIHYEEDTPYIQARIQDLYSIKDHPTLFENKLPLLIKLLSPANRVAQIIQDLPSFWKGSWSLVRNDLKSRYPKHHWPEDPMNSLPIRLKKNIK